MGKISKTFAFFLTLIVVLSCLTLLTVKPVDAQNPSPTPTPIPAIPNFTVSITNSSYYVPVTYSIDPSTGQEVANNSLFSGYVDALNITIRIKNQPLALSTPSDTFNGFKYFVEINGQSLSGFPNAFGSPQQGFGYLPSNSEYTTLTFQFSNPYFDENHDYRNEYPTNSSGLTHARTLLYPITVAKNQPVAVGVNAVIGSFYYLSMGQLMFDGNNSNWNTLTITMADGVTANAYRSPPLTIPEATPFPTVPEITPSLTPNIPRNPPHLDPIVYLIPVGVLAVVVMLSVLLYRRHRKTNNLSK
jgi:hypothetical protein